MRDNFDRQVPHAPESEISVLGGMLIDTEAAARVLDFLDEGMLYAEKHRRLFRTMVRMFQRGVPIDPPSVADELRKQGELEAVGGLDYLAELLDAVPTAANIEWHARAVREAALMRRLIDVSGQAIRDAYEPGERSVAEIMDAAASRLYSLANDSISGGPQRMKKTLTGTFEVIERLQAAKGKITGIPTGFPDLDEMTGGYQPGDLVILAARPSMGKTSLMNACAMSAAIEAGRGVVMYSLEMTRDQITQRMLCMDALIDLSRMLRGKLSDEDFVRLAQVAGPLNSAPLWIDDASTMTVLEVRARTRKLKAEGHDIGLVCVDYIQLMRGEGENRTQEVSSISRGLKAMAKELEVTVLALSQLSRANEQRSDKRPVLSDLRESGSLEQDADMVMFLYRPEYYATKEIAAEKGLQGKAELIIGKQRNGPTGSIDLFFRKECARFESVANWGVAGAA